MHRIGFFVIIVSVLVSVPSCKRERKNPFDPIHHPTLWTRTFHGSDSDAGYDVEQTTDGGYIIVGRTRSHEAGDTDAWLIKTDASGNKEWAKTFGEDGNDYAKSVCQTTDGGYVIAGTFSFSLYEGDAWVIKTDSHGNKEWERMLDDNEGDQGSDVQQALDGGYVVTGTDIHDRESAFLTKLSASGDTEWSRTIRPFGGAYSSGRTVEHTRDGGYVLAAGTLCGCRGPWLMKRGSQGNEQWERMEWHNRSDYANYAVGAHQASDGGYVIFGGSYYVPSNVWAIKTDALGDEQWEKTFGVEEMEASAAERADGGYIFLGTKKGQVWLLKMDESGNKEWEKTFGVAGSDAAHAVKQTSDGAYIVVGSTTSGEVSGADVWLIKTY
jgi:hypothetical protein